MGYNSIKEQDCWPTVDKILYLLEQDRISAAKSLWEQIPADFKMVMLQFLHTVLEYSLDVVQSTPYAEFAGSKWGDFTLYGHKLVKMRDKFCTFVLEC